MEEDLKTFKLTQLRKRALAEGLPEEKVEEAEDSDDPKAELRALILAASKPPQASGGAVSSTPAPAPTAAKTVVTAPESAKTPMKVPAPSPAPAAPKPVAAPPPPKPAPAPPKPSMLERAPAGALCV
jgi:hypothetical protein